MSAEEETLTFEEIFKIEDASEFCYRLSGKYFEHWRETKNLTERQQTFWDIEWMPTHIDGDGWFSLFLQEHSEAQFRSIVAMLREANAHESAALIEEATNLYFAANPAVIDEDDFERVNGVSDPFEWEGPDQERFFDIGDIVQNNEKGAEIYSPSLAKKLKAMVLNEIDAFHPSSEQDDAGKPDPAAS